ncbi:Hypothetical predicted protein [Cloeon dipterum]|uniref:Uncharacterized protein n=1 Tax=Cloeon dipterum TaxID=197152 RepID=A0A8S1DXA6_9INSE|nr:Hypothetical predicted protein [Cloeon dipterum]
MVEDYSDTDSQYGQPREALPPPEDGRLWGLGVKTFVDPVTNDVLPFRALKRENEFDALRDVIKEKPSVTIRRLEGFGDKEPDFKKLVNAVWAKINDSQHLTNDEILFFLGMYCIHGPADDLDEDWESYGIKI